ncbi:hypothetical protein F1559_003414 [Cyanidiococcus yangmingshanensis]|uniref:Uncharacterized protein n=1 Tax=Cyanidiococcus yangmingshanensis TaxID=2690220 RepID=A0A7J7IP03_9RHOD|nr:hypothetical protein F1559_003414 [Cyanidiococcus yangmingshanensis]
MSRMVCFVSAAWALKRLAHDRERTTCCVCLARRACCPMRAEQHRWEGFRSRLGEVPQTRQGSLGHLLIVAPAISQECWQRQRRPRYRLYMGHASVQRRGSIAVSPDPARYIGSSAHARDTRLAMILLGGLSILGTFAFIVPRWFLFASSAVVRYISLALVTFVLGLSLGAYELGNIKRLPLTIAMSTIGRLLIMPLATALLVLPLGIQLDAASVSSLLLLAASPSGYATIWIAALTDTTVRELAAMMTFSSVAFSALTIPLLLLIAAAVARFPSSVGVADYLVAGTGAGSYPLVCVSLPGAGYDTSLRGVSWSNVRPAGSG